MVSLPVHITFTRGAQEVSAVDLSLSSPVITSEVLLDLLGERAEWRDVASCRGAGASLFHSFNKADQDRALRFCATCPVTTECAEYGRNFKLVTGSIWGGHVVGRRSAAPAPAELRGMPAPAPTRRHVGDGRSDHPRGSGAMIQSSGLLA
jgi:hypothetical protein